MEYIHIKNLEKYHPKYKDRKLQWAKIYFDMVQGDPDCELIEDEIDWARLVKMILLELQARKPLPNFDSYWQKKGFNLKKRPMSLTIKMLHNFIDIVTQLCELPCLEVEKEEEKEEDSVTVTDFFSYFLLKTKKNYKLTPERSRIIDMRLKEGYTLDQLKQAVDNFAQDDWPERHKYIDIVYCIGRRNKIDNLEKWLNFVPDKPKTRVVL